MDLPVQLQLQLQNRKEISAFRSLIIPEGKIDFCSNDYLGFATNSSLLTRKHKLISELQQDGATGSRLISGNSILFEKTEKDLANFFNADAALIFNSGYTANLGLFSSVPQKNDLILYDEKIHASVIDGMRMSLAARYKFRHNEVNHLSDLITAHRDKFDAIYVAVESVYSMDGDLAPLNDIITFCQKNNCFLIVDEAHAVGIFGEKGRGLVNELKLEESVFARVVTFGKALGSHGACVLGSNSLRDYLINFSRPFIYSTALPASALISIAESINELQAGNYTEEIKLKIEKFRDTFEQLPSARIFQSAIAHVLLSGNQKVQSVAEFLYENGFFIKAIKSPTVPSGSERLRICVHHFNSERQMVELKTLLNTFPY